MRTRAYPTRLFGDRAPPGATGATGAAPGGWSATRPLLLTGGGKVLLAVFIVFGLVGVAVPSGESGSGSSQGSSTAGAWQGTLPFGWISRN
jgi:hypothetical protein